LLKIQGNCAFSNPARGITTATSISCCQIRLTSILVPRFLASRAALYKAPFQENQLLPFASPHPHPPPLLLLQANCPFSAARTSSFRNFGQVSIHTSRRDNRPTQRSCSLAACSSRQVFIMAGGPRLQARQEAAVDIGGRAPAASSFSQKHGWSVHQPLTRENLRLLDKMTKPSGKGSQPKSGPSTTTDETKTTKISTTSSGFANLAFLNGVLGPPSSEAPENLEHLQARINRDRGTPPPSESAYRAYVHAVQTAPNEASMISDRPSF
jgi:hypothetical protein